LTDGNAIILEEDEEDNDKKDMRNKSLSNEKHVYIV
jgi:hypothetical protein